MSFESVRFERFFFVRWVAPPTLADVHLLRELLAGARKQAGESLLYVACVPAHLDGVPTADVRAALVRGLRKALSDDCRSIDLVMPSPGLMGAMLRAAIRAMAIASGMGPRLFIHESNDSALDRLRPHCEDDRILQHLQAKLESRTTAETG
jgi:hypothetical protein